LQHEDAVAIAGGAILREEWVGQTAKPLSQKRVNLLCGETVGELLRARRLRAAEEPVVERFEGNTATPLIKSLALYGK
jgi:hypothetical protein